MVHKIRTTSGVQSWQSPPPHLYGENPKVKSHWDTVSAGSLANMQHFNNIQCWLSWEARLLVHLWWEGTWAMSRKVIYAFPLSPNNSSPTKGLSKSTLIKIWKKNIWTTCSNKKNSNGHQERTGWIKRGTFKLCSFANDWGRSFHTMEESVGYIVTVKSKAEKKVFTTRCHLSKRRRHMLIFKRMNLMVCKQFLNTTHKNTQKHF